MCDLPDFFSKKTLKARKEHFCAECGSLIKIGCHYEKITGKWNGEISRYKVCIECVGLRNLVADYSGECDIVLGNLIGAMKKIEPDEKDMEEFNFHRSRLKIN